MVSLDSFPTTGPRILGSHQVSYVPSRCIPDPDARVQTAGSHAGAVEGDGIDLAVVSREGVKATALRDAPNFGRGIVAAGDDDVAFDFQTSDASLVSDQDVTAQPTSDIPDTQSRIPRA